MTHRDDRLTKSHGQLDHDHGDGKAGGRARHACPTSRRPLNDAADQVDAALEADARGRRALWISLSVLAVTAGLQAGVVARPAPWPCSATCCTTSPTR